MKNGFFSKMKMNISLGRLILTSLMLLIVIVGGTFAWLTYRSEQSALVLTIGDINKTQIKLTPYEIKTNIIPSTGPSSDSGTTSCEELRDSTNSYVCSDVTVTNQRTEDTTLTLFYKVNNNNTYDGNLKYKIVSSSEPGNFDPSQNIVKEGTINPNEITNNEIILSSTVTGSMADLYYRVYLWADGTNVDNTPLQGTSTSLELNGAIGSVTITGKNQYKDTLTASLIDSGLPSNYEYQWYYNSSNSTTGGTLIPDATGSTYTIQSGLGGKYIYVKVTTPEGIVYTDVSDSTNNTFGQVNPIVSAPVTVNMPEDFTYSGSPAEFVAYDNGTVPVNVALSPNIDDLSRWYFTYYTDSTCSTKTSTSTGASAAGKAPVDAGTYYVKAQGGYGLDADKVSEREKIGVTGNTVPDYVALSSGCEKFMITPKVVEISWSADSDGYTYNNSMQYLSTPDVGGVNGETISVSSTGAKNAGTHSVSGSCSSVSGGRTKCGNYSLTNTTDTLVIKKYAPTLTLSSTSGTVPVFATQEFNVQIGQLPFTASGVAGKLTISCEGGTCSELTESFSNSEKISEATISLSSSSNVSDTIYYTGHSATSRARAIVIQYIPNDEENYSSRVMTFNASVGRVTPILTIDTSYEYTGSPIVPTVTATYDGNVIEGLEYTYAYSTEGCRNSLDSAPADVGTYSVIIQSAQTNQYNSASFLGCASGKQYEIVQIDNPITVKSNSLTYNGSAQNLVTVSNAQGTVYYSTGTVLNGHNYSTYGSTTIPTATNAGTYAVYYYVAGNNNYKAKSGTVGVTISKYTPTLTLSSASGTVEYSKTATFSATVKSTAGNVPGKLTTNYNPTSDGKYSAEVQIVTLPTLTATSSGTTSQITYAGKVGTTLNSSITVTFTPDNTNNFNAVQKTYNVTSVTPTTDTITVNAASNVTYDGSAHGTTATAGSGKTVTLTYYSNSTCTVKTSTSNAASAGGAPKSAGTYYAIGTTTATDNYKAGTSACTKAITIDKAANPVTVSFVTSTLTYNGNAQTLVQNPGSTYGVVFYSTTTELNSSNFATAGSTTLATGTNAGDYTVYYYSPGTSNYAATSDGLKISGTKTISKKANTITVTAKTGLVYNGNNQNLVTVSNAQGTVYYSTSTSLTSTNYKTSGSTTLAQGKNAGTYTVYYYVEGNNNHNPKSGNVSVSIAKYTPTITFSSDSGTVEYSKTSSFEATFKSTVGSITGMVTATSGDNTYVSVSDISSSSVTATSNGGKSTITYKGEKGISTTKIINVVFTPTSDTTNFQAVSKVFNVTAVNATNDTVTVNTATNITYDGSTHGTTATAVSGKTVTLTYYSNSTCTTKTTTSNAVSAGGAPKSAGTYYAIGTTTANDNYKAGTSACTKAITIDKAANPLTVSFVTSTLTYNGNAQTLVQNPGSTYGTVYYSSGSAYVTVTPLTSDNYSTKGSTTLPTGTNATDYVVYYYSPGNTNYLATSGSLKVDGTKTIEKAENPITVTAKSGLKYNTNAQDLATVINAQGTVYYSPTTILTDSNYSVAGVETMLTGTNAGSYKVYYYVTGNGNYKSKYGNVSVTISKYTPTMSLSSTSGTVDYKGTNKFDVTVKSDVGSVTGNIQVTSVATNYVSIQNVSLSEITATSTGATSQITYYGVAATSTARKIVVVFNPTSDTTNFNSAVTTFDVTAVNTIDDTITVNTASNVTYDGSVHETTATATSGSAVTLTYYSDATCATKTTTANAETAGGAPKSAGTYYAKGVTAASTNYKAGTSACTKTITIDKADCTCSITTVPNLEYPSNSVYVTGSKNGTLKYSCTGDGSISVNANTAYLTVGTLGNTSVSLTAKNYTNSSGTSVTVSQSEGTNFKSCSTATGSVVVNPSIYSITYDVNGGLANSELEDGDLKTYGSSLTLTDVIPIRHGYKFVGWNTAADGSGTTYDAGGQYNANITSSTTLYAKWEAVTEYLMGVVSPDNGDSRSNFLRSSIKRNKISSITFVAGTTNASGTVVDVSRDENNSVLMWYGDANASGYYDIYIGSEHGYVTFSDGYRLFAYMSKLTSISFYDSTYNINVIDTSEVTNMSQMFKNCGLSTIDLSSFDTSNVTDMSSMFQSSSFSSLDVSGFNSSKVTNMYLMFSSMSNLTSLNVYGLDTENVTDMSSMFSGDSSLQNINLKSFNTSKVENMSSMFQNCWSFTQLDMSSFDTSNVTDMSYMFYNLHYVNLDLSNFNTSKVEDMSYMFFDIYTSKLDLSSFDTSNVTVMTDMFAAATFYKEIVFSDKFDTSNVVSMSGMFSGCSNLEILDVSMFNTSNVEFMGSMFYGVSSLTELNLSGFDTSKVTSMAQMFYGMSSLSKVTFGENFVFVGTDGYLPTRLTEYTLFNQNNAAYSGYWYSNNDWKMYKSSELATLSQGNSSFAGTYTIVPFTAKFYNGNDTVIDTKYYGVSKDATSSEVGAYHNASGTSLTVTVPSNLTENGLGWTFAGVTTSKNNTEVMYDSSSKLLDLSDYHTQEIALYTVYQRDINFYSGSPTTKHTYTANQYMNPYGYTDANGYPNYSTFTTDNLQTISGYYDIGWEHKSISGSHFAESASISISPLLEPNLYGLYSVNETATATFYSGIASNRATHTATLYYYSSPDANGKTGCRVTTPTNYSVQPIADLEMDGFVGWRDDTTAGTKEFTAGGISDSCSTTYYAVYSRQAAFFHHSQNSPIHVPQYYSSSGNYGVKTPTSTNIGTKSGYTILGWRDDTTPGVAEFAPGATSSLSVRAFYAVYQLTDGVKFYSGVDGTTVSTATQYYNANGSYSSVTMPTPVSISGYTALGWRGETWWNDDSEQSITAGTVHDGNDSVYYAQYQSNQDILFYSGVDSSTQTSQDLYYYSRTSDSNVGKYVYYIPSKDTAAAIDGKTILGWKSTNSADFSGGYVEGDEWIESEDAIMIFYAFYKGSAEFWRLGDTINTTKYTRDQYYNSFDSYYIYSMPSDSTVYRYETFKGWRDDENADVSEFAAAESSTSSSNVFYAVYDGEVTFYSGISSEVEEVETFYHNASGEYKVVTPSTIAAIDGYSILGWSNMGVVFNDDTVFSPGDVFIGNRTYSNASKSFYALYDTNNDLSFFSGRDAASINVDGSTDDITNAYTEITRKQYYMYEIDELSGSQTPTPYKVFVPSIDDITPVTGKLIDESLSTDGNIEFVEFTYDALGWLPNHRADIVESHAYSNMFSVSDELMTNDYYAGYKTTINCYSGTKENLTTTTVNKYFNSSGKYYTELPSTAATVDGFTFSNWGLSRTATSGSYSLGDTSNSGANTYYAIYTRPVNFYSGVSSATTTVANQYYNTTGRYYVAEPSDAIASIVNWTAKGWRTDSTPGVLQYYIGGNSSSSSVFYAVYERTLYFKSGAPNTTLNNDGTAKQYYNSSPEGGESTVDAPTPLDVVYWSRNGYTSKAYGTSREIGYGTTVTPLYSTGNTFYAVYTRPYQLTFDPNGGVGTPAYQQINYARLSSYMNTIFVGSSINFTDKGFTREGYTLVGWNTVAGGNGTNYSLGTNDFYSSFEYTVASNLGETLYAQWQLNEE